MVGMMLALDIHCTLRDADLAEFDASERPKSLRRSARALESALRILFETVGKLFALEAWNSLSTEL